MDSSWGTGTTRVPSGDRAERERLRAEDRDRRARERIAATQARTEDRASRRDAEAAAREREREVRRTDEAARSSTRAAGPADGLTIHKRRPSGAKSRTGEETRIERDTRAYRTVVDVGRMRELARRGASMSALAGAFGITMGEVAAALADQPET